ncbi:hypothetical protein C0989_009766 [Termitomyces sp. Mn162]|nr:hypothetical protein C0989_009766 [Termitomyces sp. Mn162]
MANGFSYANSHEWANLGQGAPEVGPIPNAPARPTSIPIPIDSLEYAPTTGVKALREAVANLYNATYRGGKSSQYTYENVCIVPGGRSGLSRVAAVIGDVYTSFQIPDYTAYDQVLSAFKRLVPVPTALDAKTKYKLDIQQTKKDIQTQGLAVILASNPRNPTGQSLSLRGNDLKELAALGREGTTVILDEACYAFMAPPASDLVVSSIPAKRDHVLSRLHALGLDVDIPPNSTFYIWLNLEKLPEPLNNGLVFFEELLKHKTIVIPGIFFDINPAHRRNLFNSPCHHYVRLSFGPPIADLDKGLDAIGQVLQKARRTGTRHMGHGYAIALPKEEYVWLTPYDSYFCPDLTMF